MGEKVEGETKLRFTDIHKMRRLHMFSVCLKLGFGYEADFFHPYTRIKVRAAYTE